MITIITPNTIILGDFNLDLNKENDANYGKKNLFDDMTNLLGHHYLMKSCSKAFIACSKLLGLKDSTLLRFHRVLHERDYMKGNKVVTYTRQILCYS